MAVAFQLGLGLVRLYLANMKYFLEHILTIGFQFWEPPRGVLTVNHGGVKNRIQKITPPNLALHNP